VLRGLLERYPQHPLVRSKLRDLEAIAAGERPSDPVIDDGHTAGNISPAPPGRDSAEMISGRHLQAVEGTEALEIDEIEELDDPMQVSLDDELDDDLDNALDGESHDSRAMGKEPQVLLEKPVDEGDADTHYDLGLAYKEMGLYDEAVKAFDKTLRAPGREVKGRLMIGMCHREQGNASEAIHQFKQGLHSDTVSEAERQSLYYEIGQTYEAIGDDTEALYYFELVLKRDPGFADAAMRADQLRPRVGRNARPPVE
jgi:tetratricopeptide (TPR) repeat protein